MKKTFLIGFLGLLLVGGFLVGLYLVNQQTNPGSSAAEIINPISVPVEPTEAAFSATRVSCEKFFGKKEGDVEFKKACDVDLNGLINILDLSKLQ
jgi:hypothetical protein